MLSRHLSGRDIKAVEIFIWCRFGKNKEATERLREDLQLGWMRRQARINAANLSQRFRNSFDFTIAPILWRHLVQ
jgi:hypothetical protein